jgi:ankyrin repeat protein
MAATCGHGETVRVLVRMGGGAFALDANGNTPLHCAAGCDHMETVKCLMEEMGGGVLAAQGADGGTPLHRAATGGHVESVRKLVDLGGQHACTCRRWRHSATSGCW